MKDYATRHDTECQCDLCRNIARAPRKWRARRRRPILDDILPEIKKSAQQQKSNQLELDL